MTTGIAEQSSMNWIKSGLFGFVRPRIIWLRTGTVLEYSMVKLMRRSRTGDNELQLDKICSISSDTARPAQDGARQYPLGLLDQKRQSLSVLYLPLNMTACTPALAISYGDDPAARN